jgi:hypothetical protein
MTIADPIVEPKKLEPGTTGWTAADLDHPAIESWWMSCR